MSEKLAIDGGTPVREKSWPAWPRYGEEEARLLRETLESGQWWWVGAEAKGVSKVLAFAERWAQYQQAKHAICVPNGTLALEVVLRAAGIGCGDEVIVPPYTFVATATAPLSVGAAPVFADIDPETFLLDAKAVEAVITPRTRALIPVHIGGCPANMDAIMEVARRHNLIVIEDAAQAHGAEWKGRRVGAIGDMGTFSFQASKNLNCGEGGAIVTDSEELYSKAWSVHNLGRVPGGGWYEHSIMGSNYRMTEWQGAILLAQLARLDEQNQKRRAQAALLDRLLSEIEGVAPLKREAGVTAHSYHLYIFRYDPQAFGNRSRDEFIQAMVKEGIACSQGYRPLYKESLFTERAQMAGLCQRNVVDYRQVQCPICEKACEEAVWLFQSQLLGEPSDMEQVAEAISKIQRAWF